MERVLVIDDDLFTLNTLGMLLQAEGIQAHTCATLREARQLVSTDSFDAILADFRLTDGTGLDLVRLLRNVGDLTPVVIVTGFGTVSLAVEAMHAGACHVIEKPLVGDDVLRVLRSAACVGRAVADSTLHVSADGLRRWAGAVCSVIDAEHDPHTLNAWSRLIAVAPETLRTWCRCVGLPVKASLDLARLLRCIRHAQLQHCRPELLLDVAHPRTLSRLLAG